MFRPRSSSATASLGASKTDDEVRALAILADRVGESTAAPRADLDDLAAVGGDTAGDAVEDLLDPVVGACRVAGRA